MPITFSTAKQILSKYVERSGVCPTDEERVNLFVRQVLDYLLISGHHGSIRKFSFCAVKGCFTIPYELEVPLKVQIEGRVGTVWDKWFEFHSTKELAECIPAGKALIEDPNYYPTVYDLPQKGARVGILGTCNESSDAHAIIKGKDPTGREIITTHKGEQIVGEYIGIRKGELVYSSVTFGDITAVVKTRTNGYTPLFWVIPERNTKGFLADYSPLEEHPSYRRFRLTDPRCNSTVKVSVLGKIRLKEFYADNDYIPFDSIYALNLAGQAVNANYNDAPDLAKAKDSMLSDIIIRDNEHHRVNNGQPAEVFIPLSGGVIRNIVG